MKRIVLALSVWAGCLLVMTCTPAASAHVGQPCEKFVSEIALKSEEAAKAGRSAVVGKDGWLFFAPELRSMSVGRFWGDEAAKVSRATNPEYADPVPAILDFKRQLDKAGISLLIVPVPAKCTIYPEFVSDAGVPADGGRTDPYHQEFYRILEAKGIRVLDLVPSFLRNRAGAPGPLYCRQDTHWSGPACALAAGLIAAEIRKQPWVNAMPKRHYMKEGRQVTINGDLLEALADPSMKQESLHLSTVRERTKSGTAPVADWRQSPVLLLGDSHNLIFHSGDDMQAQGAGLADHLAAELGFPVDVVAVRGSGATPARLNLMRRRDNMSGKRMVIWCFSVREFTEGQGWRKVPIIK